MKRLDNKDSRLLNWDPEQIANYWRQCHLENRQYLKLPLQDGYESEFAFRQYPVDKCN